MSTTSVGPERRVHARRKVLLPARLRHGVIESPATILNISRSGAMVEVDLPPATGSRVVLLRHGQETAAVVVWLKQNRLGVLFDTPLTEDEVRACMSPAP